jgi:hypothetical protein
MSWFNPKNPQTGNGKAKPKGQSLPAEVRVVFRDEKGKKVPPAVKPTKKGKAK